MSNDFVKVVRSVSFREAHHLRDRVPIQPLVRPEIPFEVWVWTVLGRWNLLREGTIILLFAQLIYARDGQRPYLSSGNKRQDYVQRPSENFHTNRFPKMICSDQGTNFTSKLSEVFLSVMGVSPRFPLQGILKGNTPQYKYRHVAIRISIWTFTFGYPYFLLKGSVGWRKKHPKPIVQWRSIWKTLIEKLRRAHEIAAETVRKDSWLLTRHTIPHDQEKQFTVGDKVLRAAGRIPIGRGGKSRHGTFADSIMAHYQFLLCSFRTKNAGSTLFKSYGSGASETPGILIDHHIDDCSDFLQNMGAAT
ncbi:hypothetical protein TNCV_4715251 [Trichonephila clavipes]|nr:hypothetical protein TNCV_4715251 [Trichonephila clavipes]